MFKKKNDKITVVDGSNKDHFRVPYLLDFIFYAYTSLMSEVNI